MRLYPWMTVIFIVGYALVNISVMYFEPNTALIGALLFTAGLPLFYMLQGVFKKTPP